MRVRKKEQNPMRRRMAFSYALILLLFSGATYFFVIRTFYGIIRDNIIKTSTATMERWTDEMESVLSYGRSFLLTGAADEGLQYVMKSAAGAGEGSENGEEAEFLNSGDNPLFEIGNSRIIYPETAATKHMPAYMTVLGRDADGTFRTLYSADSSFFDKIYYEEDEWVTALMARNGSFLLSPYASDNNQYVRLSKVVYDNEQTDRIIGIEALDFDYNHLAQYILTPLRTQGSIDAALYDRSAGAFIGYKSMALTDEMKNFLGQKGSNLVRNGREIFYSFPVNGSEISIIGIRSLSDVRTAVARSLRSLSLSAVGIFLIVLSLSFFMTHRISKPILEEQYLMQLRQDQLEMQALQSQIHTHFLYNTLDTINWLALDHDAPDISHLVTNLSNLLRKSLNRGRSELTVKDEISHVESYLAIQKVRFPDVFQVEIEADEKLKDDLVLKMLLQPLVENAILHVFNVNHLDQKDNLLRITILEDRGRICMRVENNAREEDYRKVCLLLESSAPERMNDTWSGYGVISIRDRLQIAYGEHAKLSYSFEKNTLCACISIDRSYTLPDRKHFPNLPEESVWDTVS